jgi:alpha-tubulin suppressor-like RCC1 family protein
MSTDPPQVISVACGPFHTAKLKMDAGGNTTVEIEFPEYSPYTEKFSKIIKSDWFPDIPDGKVVAIAAGSGFTMALTDTGTAYMKSHGGYDDTNNTNTTKVQENVIAIAAGGPGIAYVLTSSFVLHRINSNGVQDARVKNKIRKVVAFKDQCLMLDKDKVMYTWNTPEVEPKFLSNPAGKMIIDFAICEKKYVVLCEDGTVYTYERNSSTAANSTTWTQLPETNGKRAVGIAAGGTDDVMVLFHDGTVNDDRISTTSKKVVQVATGGGRSVVIYEDGTTGGDANSAYDKTRQIDWNTKPIQDVVCPANCVNDEPIETVHCYDYEFDKYIPVGGELIGLCLDTNKPTPKTCRDKSVQDTGLPSLPSCDQIQYRWSSYDVTNWVKGTEPISSGGQSSPTSWTWTLNQGNDLECQYKAANDANFTAQTKTEGGTCARTITASINSENQCEIVTPANMKRSLHPDFCQMQFSASFIDASQKAFAAGRNAYLAANPSDGQGSPVAPPGDGQTPAAKDFSVKFEYIHTDGRKVTYPVQTNTTTMNAQDLVKIIEAMLNVNVDKSTKPITITKSKPVQYAGKEPHPTRNLIDVSYVEKTSLKIEVADGYEFEFSYTDESNPIIDKKYTQSSTESQLVELPMDMAVVKTGISIPKPVFYQIVVRATGGAPSSTPSGSTNGNGPASSQISRQPAAATQTDKVELVNKSTGEVFGFNSSIRLTNVKSQLGEPKGTASHSAMHAERTAYYDNFKIRIAPQQTVRWWDGTREQKFNNTNTTSKEIESSRIYVDYYYGSQGGGGTVDYYLRINDTGPIYT